MRAFLILIAFSLYLLFFSGLAVAEAVGSSDRVRLLYLPLTASGWQPPGPPAGNPDGHCSVPADAGEEDSSNPDRVVGNGTPQSCTSEAVVAAVAKGGVISFNCGAEPVTITMKQTAKVFNNTGPKIVLDGGGKVTR